MDVQHSLKMSIELNLNDDYPTLEIRGLRENFREKTVVHSNVKSELRNM